VKAQKKPQNKKGDPKKRRAIKYDARAGSYPESVHPRGLVRTNQFTADEAPKEAQRLKLDPRVTDAMYEVGNNIGAWDSEVDTKIGKYLKKSRQYVWDRMAKNISPNAHTKLSEGETEFIPKLDKVVDKVSTLSDEDLESLKSIILKLSDEYKTLDPKSSTASKLTKAASLAASQDWSSIKPIREKAGLTKDDLISLIQAPEDANFLEKASFSALRGAVGFKDFKNGGKFNPFKHKYKK